MSNEYVNKITKEVINSSLKTPAGGIVESKDNFVYTYTSANNISKTNTVDKAYETTTSPSKERGIKDQDTFDSETIQNDTDSKNSLTYFFGADNLKAAFKVISPASGFVSKPIKIGKASYIELSVNIIGTPDSIEYNIIDGSKKIAILPIEDSVVKNERLFSGMQTRFQVDMTKSIVIKKNNVQIDTKINELTTMDFEINSIYTIDYTPINAHAYYPENETVEIEAIQRSYGTIAPAIINAITICKHGGDTLWTV